MRDVKPKYHVEKFDGEYEVTTLKYERVQHPGSDKPTLKRQFVKEKRTGGYMLYNPRGESIHVRNEADLRQLGIDPDAVPGLVDLESGEEVANTAVSLKRLASQRVARNVGRSTVEHSTGTV